MRLPMLAALLATMIVLCGCASVETSLPPAATASLLRLKLEQADLALREARLIDAEILYRELSVAHPRLPDVWLQLGNIYARQAQLEAAMHAYKDGLEFNPQDGRLWHNLALIELRQSIRTLEMASELLPTEDPQRARLEHLHRALLVAGRPDA